MEAIKIGDKIIELRKKRGLERAELADKLGIEYQALAKYEQNARTPNPELLVDFADFFSVTTDYLYGRTEEPHSQRDYKIITIAAHHTDDPMSDLPPEAEERVQEFIELMRMKYGKKK